MTKANAVRTGVAIALTVGMGYSGCALVFWLWPEAAVTFLNGLFHGLDFRKLQSGPAPFSFASFVYALVVMMVWVFALGAIYGWLQSRFGHQA